MPCIITHKFHFLTLLIFYGSFCMMMEYVNDVKHLLRYALHHLHIPFSKRVIKFNFQQQLYVIPYAEISYWVLKFIISARILPLIINYKVLFLIFPLFRIIRIIWRNINVEWTVVYENVMHITSKCENSKFVTVKLFIFRINNGNDKFDWKNVIINSERCTNRVKLYTHN